MKRRLTKLAFALMAVVVTSPFFSDCQKTAVTSPHKKNLNARQSYTNWTMALKLAAIDASSSVYEIHISEFLYQWPKGMSICDLSIIPKSMGENLKAPVLNQNHSKHSQTTGYRYNWHIESEKCYQWPLLMTPRSLQILKGRRQFFGISFW